MQQQCAVCIRARYNLLMYYSLSQLCAALLLLLAIVYWWRSREQHAVALRSARKYCRERGIQLLDETLAFDKFAFAHTGGGRRRLSRLYGFEFCRDGQDRHRGEIILRGMNVVRVVLETGQLEITQY